MISATLCMQREFLPMPLFYQGTLLSSDRLGTQISCAMQFRRLDGDNPDNPGHVSGQIT